MELKDFISNTIEQISLGILDASEKCKEYGVVVNPNITTGSQGDYCIPKNPEHVNIQRRVQLIAMDVVVSVMNSEEKNVKGCIEASFIGVGGNTQSEKNTSNENRVKFSIPVCLPVTDIINRD